MADKSRDLQFRVLSDLSKLDLDKAARDMTELGDDGKRALDKLDDGLDAAARKVRDYADDSRDAARNIKRAFDDISDASKKSARDLDDDFDKAGQGLDDFKDEARDSGREAAASFGGGFDDITGFVQETAANAFGGFGPLGAAAGIAAAAGIGIITKAFGDSKEKAEEARQAVSDWVQAFKDGLGQISEETVQSKLNEFAQDGAKLLKEYTDQATRAGVSITDYVRAKAGDVEASKRVREQLIEQAKALQAINPQLDANAAKHGDQAIQMQKVAEELGITTRQLGEAKGAWQVLDDATRAGITATVKVDAPTSKELDELNRRIRSGIGTIVIPLEPGQSRFENNANNSRYRW